MQIYTFSAEKHLTNSRPGCALWCKIFGVKFHAVMFKKNPIVLIDLIFAAECESNLRKNFVLADCQH